MSKFDLVKRGRLFSVLWPIGCDSADVNAEEAARGSGEHQEQAVQVLELERRISEQFGACPRQRDTVHPKPVGCSHGHARHSRVLGADGYRVLAAGFTCVRGRQVVRRHPDGRARDLPTAADAAHEGAFAYEVLRRASGQGGQNGQYTDVDGMV